MRVRCQNLVLLIFIETIGMFVCVSAEKKVWNFSLFIYLYFNIHQEYFLSMLLLLLAKLARNSTVSRETKGLRVCFVFRPSER